VPRILDHLARQNNREAFLLAAMAAVFIAAWAMDHAGMSMALGAFLMGMMLSTSRYSLQIEAGMEPHKGLLMSLFFVAVGMSVDVGRWRSTRSVRPACAGDHQHQGPRALRALLSFGSGRSTALRWPSCFRRAASSASCSSAPPRRWA
jgi:hypothetical protein